MKKIIKKKKSFLLIGNYLRELSIVVIGVLISFGISNWINNKNSESDLKRHLSSIQLELKENIKELEKNIKNMKISIDYADYLQSHDKKSINRDTLDVFTGGSRIYSINSFPFKTNAFDMFKTSGVMRLVENKELLLSIWDIYSDINETKEALDVIMKSKYEEIMKELKWTEEEKKNNIPMYFFYHDTEMAYEVERISKRLLENLKETEGKLEKELN
jgi:hypothetical protein